MGAPHHVGAAVSHTHGAPALTPTHLGVSSAQVPGGAGQEAGPRPELQSPPWNIGTWPAPDARGSSPPSWPLGLTPVTSLLPPQSCHLPARLAHTLCLQDCRLKRKSMTLESLLHGRCRAGWGRSLSRNPVSSWAGAGKASFSQMALDGSKQQGRREPRPWLPLHNFNLRWVT